MNSITSAVLPSDAHGVVAISGEELFEHGGGISPSAMGILTYLLANSDDFIDGIRDGWNAYQQK